MERAIKPCEYAFEQVARRAPNADILQINHLAGDHIHFLKKIYSLSAICAISHTARQIHPIAIDKARTIPRSLDRKTEFQLKMKKAY